MTHVVRGAKAGRLEFDALLGAMSSTRLGNIDAALGLNQFADRDLINSYGIYLALGGMPTGIRIDDWDAHGHQYKRYFVLVDCDLVVSNQLDPGRKGISNYYASRINEEVRNQLGKGTGGSDSFSRFAARHLDVGRGISEFETSDFQNAIQAARERELNQGTESAAILRQVRSHSNLELLPHSEQEVIILFNALLSKGIIKGYRVLYQGGSNYVFDAGLTYSLALADENISPRDPFGVSAAIASELRRHGLDAYVHKDHFSGFSALPELCVEFKQSLGGFLRELESRTQKNPLLIDLLVVWDVNVPTNIPRSTYTLDKVQENQRRYHGTTHRLGIIGARNTDIQVICLKAVLESLGK